MDIASLFYPEEDIPIDWFRRPPPLFGPEIIQSSPIATFVDCDGKRDGRRSEIYVLSFRSEYGTVVHRNDIVQTWEETLWRSIFLGFVVDAGRMSSANDSSAQHIVDRAFSQLEEMEATHEEITYSVRAINKYEKTGRLPTRWAPRGHFDKHHIARYEKRLTDSSDPKVLTSAFLDLCNDETLLRRSVRYPAEAVRMLGEERMEAFHIYKPVVCRQTMQDLYIVAQELTYLDQSPKWRRALGLSLGTRPCRGSSFQQKLPSSLRKFQNLLHPISPASVGLMALLIYIYLYIWNRDTSSQPTTTILL